MKLAPLAVFGLLAQLAASVGVETLGGMGAYMMTVVVGLFLLALGYLLLVWGVGRISPLAFLIGSRELLLLAFSTSSSAAVMPLSIQTAETNFGVRPSTARFIVPLGATINMTGTALYQGVATVFLAQAYGIDLTGATLVLVVVTAVAASIGSPATPGVGMVILGGLLTTAGIPSSGIVLLLGVDRLLDMCRTAVNVAGDLAACLVIDPRVAAPSPAENG
jgi:Na+/H+-dicarboxylate symporter